MIRKRKTVDFPEENVITVRFACILCDLVFSFGYKKSLYYGQTRFCSLTELCELNLRMAIMVTLTTFPKRRGRQIIYMM